MSVQITLQERTREWDAWGFEQPAVTGVCQSEYELPKHIAYRHLMSRGGYALVPGGDMRDGGVTCAVMEKVTWYNFTITQGLPHVGDEVGGDDSCHVGGVGGVGGQSLEINSRAISPFKNLPKGSSVRGGHVDSGLRLRWSCCSRGGSGGDNVE